MKLLALLIALSSFSAIAEDEGQVFTVVAEKYHSDNLSPEGRLQKRLTEMCENVGAERLDEKVNCSEPVPPKYRESIDRYCAVICTR